MKIWKDIKDKVPDKVLLILIALICSILLFGYVLIIDSLNMPDEWGKFCGGCIVYVITFNYLIYELPVYKRKMKVKAIVMQLVLTILPIILLLSIFYFKLIRMPDRLIAYAVPGIGAAIVIASLYEYLLKMIEGKNSINSY